MLLIDLDLRPLFNMAAGLEGKLREAAQIAGNELAPAVHAHIVEEANKKLHARRQAFIEGVSFKQEGPDTWLIVLDAKARWIDDGLEPHEMIDDLLSQRSGKAKGPKTSKDGSRYRVIPFFHGPGKGGTSQTPAEASLQATIKSELKKANNQLTGNRGIPYAKIENGADGKPATGLLHSFDITNAPSKTGNGPGQGWGPIGSVRQGATGIPFLQGVRIYQRQVKGADGKPTVKRAIMTFRTVSSKMKGTGRWFHPGLPPAKIFDEAHAWGIRKWENEILPKVCDWVIANATGG